MHWGNNPFWRDKAMIDGDPALVRADYARIYFECGRDGLIHRMIWNWPGGERLAFEKDRAAATRSRSLQKAPKASYIVRRAVF